MEAWSDYEVTIAGGAAALAGLLFVAVSVDAAWFAWSAAHRAGPVRRSSSSSSHQADSGACSPAASSGAPAS